MQSSSLSTYIGYITGPRAEQPVGVRVVEPPAGTRQHQRGSLYAVVEVTGDHPDRAAIVDRLLSEVQRVYYSAKGSQSQVMVEAVQQTQQLLREINAHTPHYPLQLGLMCAALISGKLLVASSGPAFALVRVSDRVHMFPSEPPATVGGYGNIPVEVYRQDLQADDAMFLGGGGWLRRVPTRTLASIVAFINADNCADAADELFDQAGQMQVPGLLLVLGAGGNSEPPRPSGYGGGGYGGSGYGGSSGGGGYPSSPSGGGQGGGTQPRPAPRRPRFGGLPTALNTSPPARMPTNSPSQTMPPPLTPAQSSSSSPPTSQPPSGPSREKRQEWEQPPTEMLPPRQTPTLPTPPPSRPIVEPPPPSVPYATVDEPLVETPHRPARSLESSNRENPIVDPETVEASFEESAVQQESYRESYNAYPVSPLEEESFGGDLPVEPGDEFDPIFPSPASQERVVKAPRGPSWLEQWQAQTRFRMEQARGMFGRMLPERRGGEGGTEWEELSDESSLQSSVSTQQAKRPRFNELEAGMAAGSVRETPRRERAAPANVVPNKSATLQDEDEIDDDFEPPVEPVLEMSPFAPPTPTRGARARLFLLVALVIAILVPVVVTAVNFGQGNSRRAEAERLTARAEILLLGAQSALDQGDKPTARDRLTEAQDYLGQAIALDGSNENRSQLIATIELELQEVLQITPLYGLTEPLITFPVDARPKHVLVMNEDIFVIDEGRQALIQYRFDPATGTVADQIGQVILKQGDSIDGATVGTLADLAWLPLIPGFEDRPSLLITDRNNNLFRYDQRVEGATLMQVADRATWGSIGQVQTFNGRVYLADEVKGSLLRYDPGRFEAAGEPWFAADVPVNLAGLISMEIDGDIWMLFSNGVILRWREHEMLPFSPENSIGLAETPVDMYVTRQESAYIYLVDGSKERILVYDKNGTYIGQLRAPEEDLLRGLSGLYIDEVGGVMYILTQTGLFTHPVLP